MKIAVDVDRTIYDTDRCTADIAKRAWEMYPDPKDAKLRLKAIVKGEGNIHNWFDPAYLIPEAVDALRELSKDNTIAICTLRRVPTRFYSELLDKTGIKISEIWQPGGYFTKVGFCNDNGYNILIDDDVNNLRDHYNSCRVLPGYKLNFILYTGFSVADFSLKEDSFKENLSDSVYPMHSWSELSGILSVIEQRSEK